MNRTTARGRTALAVSALSLVPVLAVTGPAEAAASNRTVTVSTSGRGELTLTLPVSTTEAPAAPPAARALGPAAGTDLVLRTVIAEDDAPETSVSTVELPERGRMDTTDNGGALVVDAHGTVAGVFSPPEALDADGDRVRVSYRVDGADLALVVESEEADRPITATVVAAATLVAGVAVEEYQEGTRYLVTPTEAGRTAVGDTAHRSGFAEAVALGVANRNNLFDQYRCHPMSQVARGKESWNLEEWRPDVGILRTLLAACNP